VNYSPWFPGTYTSTAAAGCSAGYALYAGTGVQNQVNCTPTTSDIQKWMAIWGAISIATVLFAPGISKLIAVVPAYVSLNWALAGSGGF
jgi:hypothetical protein